MVPKLVPNWKLAKRLRAASDVLKIKHPAEAAWPARSALFQSEHSSEPRCWGIRRPGPLVAFLDLGVEGFRKRYRMCLR